MATAGLEVYNDSGTIQVTQDFVGWGLRAKGTITLASEDGLALICRGTLTLPASKPLLALLPPQGTRKVTVTKTTYNAATGNWTYYIAATGVVNAVISYWLFDDATTLNITDKYGFAVYRADGSLAFHSSMRPVRVVGFNNLTPPVSGAPKGNITADFAVPSGKTYAVIIASSCYREKQEVYRDQDQVGSGNTRMTISYFYTACMNNGTSLTAGLFLYDSWQEVVSGHTEYDDITGQISQWVVDVTNY